MYIYCRDDLVIFCLSACSKWNRTYYFDFVAALLFVFMSVWPTCIWSPKNLVQQPTFLSFILDDVGFVRKIAELKIKSGRDSKYCTCAEYDLSPACLVIKFVTLQFRISMKVCKEILWYGALSTLVSLMAGSLWNQGPQIPKETRKSIAAQIYTQPPPPPPR